MTIWAYLLAGAFGAAVGLAELLFRYRDSPLVLFKRAAAWTYIGFNAAASAGAAALIVALDWKFGKTGSALDATRVLVAGFGSVALFRSNLFVVKAGDENIGAGPSLVLAGILGAADRAVDREQAQTRANSVRPVMGEVNFDLAKQALVSFALTATVSVSPKAAEELKVGVAALDSADFADNVKSMILGLMLIDEVGLDVLKRSVDALAGSICIQRPVPKAKEGATDS